MYEVLGAGEDGRKLKRGIGKNRSAVILGGNTESYNTLKFEDN